MLNNLQQNCFNATSENTHKCGRNQCGECEDLGIVIDTCFQVEGALRVGEKHNNFFAIRVPNKERLRPKLHAIRVPKEMPSCKTEYLTMSKISLKIYNVLRITKKEQIQ